MLNIRNLEWCKLVILFGNKNVRMDVTATWYYMSQSYIPSWRRCDVNATGRDSTTICTGWLQTRDHGSKGLICLHHTREWKRMSCILLSSMFIFIIIFFSDFFLLNAKVKKIVIFQYFVHMSRAVENWVIKGQWKRPTIFPIHQW